jgi:hypothetical protein
MVQVRPFPHRFVGLDEPCAQGNFISGASRQSAL